MLRLSFRLSSYCPAHGSDVRPFQEIVVINSLQKQFTIMGIIFTTIQTGRPGCIKTGRQVGRIA